MSEFDVLICNGQVVDGTGAPAYVANIAIKNGRIAAIGQGLGNASHTIDATGLVVTPGFVDVHTHFDGQATWDERLWPTSQQGVTTAVMGNCGVGFAPCRPEDRVTLIELMEGVEDIPDTALHEGLPWTWESFPQYLQTLAERRYDIDIAALLPHAPLRVYAMGERALQREKASADDLQTMQNLVREGLAAGAVGLSTSRTMAHRSKSGDFTPMYQAVSDELLALGQSLKNYPNSVFQMISDFEHTENEFSILTRVSEDTGCASTLTVLQYSHRPQLHRELLHLIEQANASGQRIMGQVLNRPVGVLMGFECSLNPFSCKPSYEALAQLPPAERIAALAQPATRSAILSEKDGKPHLFMEYFGQNFAGMYPWLGDQPNYLPKPEDSVQALADAANIPALEWMYDFMLGKNGQALVYLPMANYLNHDSTALLDLLTHPHTVPALGDGGAHVGTICDGSATTFLLTEWVGDRRLIQLEDAVQMLTQRPASLYGFHDRGALEVGKLADINIIDLEQLKILSPHIERDLPAGGKRFLQGAEGYRYTLKSGQITYQNGTPTKALPGRLIKRSEFIK